MKKQLFNVFLFNSFSLESIIIEDNITFKQNSEYYQKLNSTQQNQ